MEKRRSELIADELETLILEGILAFGDRLDEVQLAERFSVSRTPVREAFQRLAQSGLVEQIPRRGVFVHQPGPFELIQMFEVMAELEALSARLAAVRISNEALEDLRTANAQCQRAANTQDADGYYDVNERFHQIIYKQSGNDFLEQECLRLHRRLKPFRRLQLRLRGRLKQSMAEHEDILDALDAGDGDRAAAAIRQHVAVQGEKFYHLMTSLKPVSERSA
jgi:DNA-binding GntR family transcriptional regulator